MDQYELARQIRALIGHSSGVARLHLQAAHDATVGTRQPLSDKQLEAMPMKTTLADPTCPGLLAKRTARSGVVWYVRRQSGGKDKLNRIGTHPETSAEAARKLWQQVKAGEVALGTVSARAAESRTQAARDVVLLSTVIDSYVEFAQEHRSKSTARQARGNLRQFLGAFGDAPIEMLTPTLVLDTLVDIEDERGSEAAKKTRDAISRMWQHGQGTIPGHKVRSKDCLISMDLTNPVREVRYQQRPPKGPMRPQELRAYWSNLPATNMRQIVKDALVVQAITGSRIGETCQLNVDWIDRDDGWIEIPAGVTKNRQPHQLAITKTVAEILDRQVSDGQEFIFEVSQGKALDPKSVNAEFRENLKQLGIFREDKAPRDQPSPHRVRASAYTWMQGEGIDQRIVDRVFAHNPPTPQRTYGGESALWQGVREAVVRWTDHLDSLHWR